MTLEEFRALKLGHLVTCVNSEGWCSFVEGETYAVTDDWWGTKEGVNLDGQPVAAEYHEDFEVY